MKLKTTPYPSAIFYLWAEVAAWEWIAQDDCVDWSPLRRKATRFLCGIALDILGKLWWWI